MITRSVILRLLVCFLNIASYGISQDLVALIKNVKSSVVVIKTFSKAGSPIAQGSGFFINMTGEVITNNHVIADAAIIEIETTDGETYKARNIITRDVQSDLAKLLIDIPADKIKPLRLNNILPEVGEKILVIGSPQGLEQTATEGIVSAVRKLESFGYVIQISAPISPGSSGSPVMNMLGQVIGVATFQMIDGQNLNFAMPSELLVRLDKIAKSTIDVKPISDEAEKQYFEGTKRAWVNDYNAALPFFQKAVSLKPDYYLAYSWIGICKLMQGDYDKAIEIFKIAINIDAANAMAYKGLCCTYYSASRYPEAVTSCTMAVTLDGTSSSDYSNLGLAHMANNQDTKKALKYCSKAIELDSKSDSAYQCLGFAYFYLGRYREAERAFIKDIELDAMSGQSIFFLGMTYVRLGELESAMSQYLKLKQLDQGYAKSLLEAIYPP